MTTCGTLRPQWTEVNNLREESKPNQVPGWGEFKFYALQDDLDKLSGLENGWDSYNAEPPNSTALKHSSLLIQALQLAGFLPSRVMPSVEGGVGLVFVKGDKYADIECFNTGTIAAVHYDKESDPQAWELRDFPNDYYYTVRKIQLFLNAK